jgi:hypothetical protein
MHIVSEDMITSKYLDILIPFLPWERNSYTFHLESTSLRHGKGRR